jgi:hypothetical protein
VLTQLSGNNLQKKVLITSTPSGMSKSTLLGNANLCQEVFLPQVKPMKTHQYRLKDKIQECAIQLAHHHPHVLAKIMELDQLKETMPTTGMHILTEHFHISQLRKDLDCKYQARCIKYALYGLYLQQWIFHESEWPNIRKTLDTTFAWDMKHVREALYAIVSTRAKLIGKSQQVSNLICGF